MTLLLENERYKKEFVALVNKQIKNLLEQNVLCVEN